MININKRKRNIIKAQLINFVKSLKNKNLELIVLFKHLNIVN